RRSPAVMKVNPVAQRGAVSYCVAYPVIRISASGSRGEIPRMRMLPWSGEMQPGHQVHQRRLAGAVRPDQARDSRRDVQRDAVHAEHLAVELRDLVEYDSQGVRAPA